MQQGAHQKSTRRVRISFDRAEVCEIEADDLLTQRKETKVANRSHGGILAPTDPVLASDEQVPSASDRDRLRFALTGEAGLNDGTAFPFVMFGLGLLGHHDLGAFGWRWFAVEVAWAITAGIAIGGVLGTAMGRWVLHLRTTYREAVGLDDLLALGLIALSYGAALLVHGYGFLAVFAAGIALRRIERMRENVQAPPDVVQAAHAAQPEETATTLATDTTTAPGYMAEAALGFTVQLERIAEVAIVVILGAMITRSTMALDAWWFVLALFVVVRPLALLLVRHRHTPTSQRRLMAWFGIRGVGSFYYLMYALQHGVEGSLADRLTAITFTAIAASAVVHGVCVTADAAIQSFARGGAEAVSARRPEGGDAWLWRGPAFVPEVSGGLKRR